MAIAKFDEFVALRDSGLLNEYATASSEEASMLLVEAKSYEKNRKVILDPLLKEFNGITDELNADIALIEKKINEKYKQNANLPRLGTVQSMFFSENTDYKPASFKKRLATMKSVLSPFKRARITDAASRLFYNVVSAQLVQSYMDVYIQVTLFISNADVLLRNENNILLASIQNRLLKNMIQSTELGMIGQTANKQSTFYSELMKSVSRMSKEGDANNPYKGLNNSNKLLDSRFIELARQREEASKSELESFSKGNNVKPSLVAYAEMMLTDAVEKATTAAISIKAKSAEPIRQFSVERLKSVVTDAVSDESRYVSFDPKTLEQRVAEVKKEAKEKRLAIKKKAEEAEKAEEDKSIEFKDEDGISYKKEDGKYTMTDEDGESTEIDKEDFEKEYEKYKDAESKRNVEEP